MQSVSPTELASRLMELLKVKAGSEIELSVLRNGSLLLEKAKEPTS
jgi:hypothetical protein